MDYEMIGNENNEQNLKCIEMHIYNIKRIPTYSTGLLPVS